MLEPQAILHVDLGGAGGHLSRGFVLRRADGALMVEFIDDVRFLIGQPAKVHFHHDRKFYEIGAVVQERLRTTPTPQLRLLLTGEPRLADRRDAYRVTVAAPVPIRLEGQTEARVLDVSSEGLAVISARQYAPGDYVSIMLSHDGGQHRGVAIVRSARARRDRQHRIGFQIAPAQHELAYAARALCNQIQREQLQRISRVVRTPARGRTVEPGVDTMHLSEQEYDAQLQSLSSVTTVRGRRRRRRSNRRQHERYPLRQDARLICQVTPDHAVPTQFLVNCSNLSASGVGFFHDFFIHPGTACVMTIISSQRTGFRITGRIARCRHIEGRTHEVGVAFDSVINPLAMLDEVVEMSSAA